MDSRYQEIRQRIEDIFGKSTRIDGDTSIVMSPSGKFQLEIAKYSTGPHTWSYSRGIVTRVSDSKPLADVKRNYGHFWYCWIEHPNGKEYLLCGEDYQGYCAVNLTDELYHVYFPEDGYRGIGFCWTAVYPSPDKLTLAVDGCYWACPYDLVFYDFQTPDALPYQEIGRCDNITECEGWKDNETFALKREIEVRASDGKEYNSLSEDEQAELDADSSLASYRIDRMEIRRPSLND
jgi:hypothetical protein